MVRPRGAQAGGPDRRPVYFYGMRGLLAIAALSLLSAAATAEPPPTSTSQPAPEPDDATLDSVTVEARRRRELLERQVSAFVSEIAITPRHESLSRWQLPICPLVAGLPFEEGKFVFQRVSQVASDAGIPLGPPDCQPNLLIVMTREPEALLRYWWDKQPRLFNTDRGSARIERTIRTDAPVRVFYNACSVPPGMAKTFAIRVLGHCNAGGSGSRLTWSTVRVIYSVIIVVDKRRTGKLELQALTDYIAMNSLAQIRPSPDLGTAPTILRLFEESDATRPQTLSKWDLAFLKSLYDTDVSSVAQLSEIKHRMKQDLAR